MRFLSTVAACAVLLALLLTGCQKSEPADPTRAVPSVPGSEPAVPVPPGAEGGATPQEAFEGMTAVLRRTGGICGDLLPWVDPAARPTMILSLWMGVMTSTREDAAPAFSALMQQHGVSHLAAEWQQLTPQDMAEPARMAAFANRVLAGRDLRALGNALFLFKVRHTEQRTVLAPPIASLDDVAIRGDRAQGAVVWTDGSRHPARFVRVKGRWYVVPEE